MYNSRKVGGRRFLKVAPGVPRQRWLILGNLVLESGGSTEICGVGYFSMRLGSAG